MQRQSLGGSSPGSKHHNNNINGVSKEVRLFDDDDEVEETSTRKERALVVSDIEEEEKKTQQQRHHLRSISQTEKSIHLIPILTIFCLLILYLCSYDPPLKDLAHIDGFRKISNRIDSSEIDDIGRFSDLEHKAGVLPILSHRSLHEIRKDGRKSRSHRKIGDY